MSGHSGSAVAVHTLIVRLRGVSLCITKAQKALLKRAQENGGSLWINRREVRTAEILVFLKLVSVKRPIGSIGSRWPKTVDGERYEIEVLDGVTVDDKCGQ